MKATCIVDPGGRIHLFYRVGPLVNTFCSQQIASAGDVPQLGERVQDWYIPERWEELAPAWEEHRCETCLAFVNIDRSAYQPYVERILEMGHAIMCLRTVLNSLAISQYGGPISTVADWGLQETKHFDDEKFLPFLSDEEALLQLPDSTDELPGWMGRWEALVKQMKREHFND